MEENKVFTGNFSNSIQLSGLIANKPVFKDFTRPNGVVSVSAQFMLTQRFIGFGGKEYTKRFLCTTRSPAIVEELKKAEKQFYVSLLGKLDSTWNAQRQKMEYYPLIEEMAIESICKENLL